MVILRLREGLARVSSHSRALSGKWTVIFQLKAFKPFISRSRNIFAQRVSGFGFSRPDYVRLRIGSKDTGNGASLRICFSVRFEKARPMKNGWLELGHKGPRCAGSSSSTGWPQSWSASRASSSCRTRRLFPGGWSRMRFVSAASYMTPRGAASRWTTRRRHHENVDWGGKGLAAVPARPHLQRRWYSALQCQVYDAADCQEYGLHFQQRTAHDCPVSSEPDRLTGRKPHVLCGHG